MTELGFLLELFLNPKLPRGIKTLVAERIKIVENNGGGFRAPAPSVIRGVGDPRTLQAASTQAILDRNPDLAAVVVPVEHIAQTPAAVAAINSRQQAITQGMSGKPEKGQTSPRKF